MYPKPAVLIPYLEFAMQLADVVTQVAFSALGPAGVGALFQQLGREFAAEAWQTTNWCCQLMYSRE